MTAIVDTSFLVSLINPREQHHQACVAVARQLRERLVIPQVVLPEACYLVDKYVGDSAMRAMVRQLTLPEWNLEPLQEGDMARVVVLLDQYQDQRLDFVDACIVAMAERLRARRVLTLDRRHFSLVRLQHGATFEILPT